MRVWLGGALALVAMNANAAVLRDFRLTQGPESTRVVLDLGAPGSYNVFTLANPNRVVIDLPGIQKPGDVLTRTTPQGVIKAVRSGPHDGGLRVVLDVGSSVTPKAFGMPPAGGYGYRLIVDLLPPVASAAPVVPAVAAAAVVSAPSTPVVAAATSAPAVNASGSTASATLSAVPAAVTNTSATAATVERLNRISASGIRDKNIEISSEILCCELRCD